VVVGTALYEVTHADSGAVVSRHRTLQAAVDTWRTPECGPKECGAQRCDVEWRRFSEEEIAVGVRPDDLGRGRVAGVAKAERTQDATRKLRAERVAGDGLDRL